MANRSALRRRLRGAASSVGAVVALTVAAGCGSTGSLGGADDAGALTGEASTTTSTAWVPSPPRAEATVPPSSAVPARLDEWLPVDGWREDLAALRVAEPSERDTYERAHFGEWIDHDGDGCNTRCEVIERQRLDHVDGLPAGGWNSVLDGIVTDRAGDLDVDHVVPLAEAWVSGAATWSPLRRLDFANDLEPGGLLAVSASVNRSKGDRDPAEWVPPDESVWCGYAAAWVRTKVRWDLSVDPLEFTALATMLDTCP